MSNAIRPSAALMAVACAQQGYFTTKQAIVAGYADNTHPYHVHAGNWSRERRGIYRLAHLPPPENGEMMAWLLWSRGRDERPLAAISHRTALSLFELDSCDVTNIHITVPPAFRRNTRPSAAVVLHRASLDPEDVTQMRGLTVCRPLRALWDLANTEPASADDLRSMADEARGRCLIMERDVLAMEKREKLPRFLARLFR